MTSLAGSLYVDLRKRGACLRVSGDKLIVEAPRDVLTAQDRLALAAVKSGILEALTEESRILAMTLAEFEKTNLAIEVQVPWLDVSLYFVPRAQQVEHLVRIGVHRGRVYTARELTNLTNLPCPDEERPSEIKKIAQMKLAFGAMILDVSADDAERGAPAKPVSGRDVCGACGGHERWRSTADALVCGVCHPPANPTLVAEWITAVEPTRG
ncbi:MAG: hypothetical protein LAO51_10510 [Acidobacteriia bacterium]|nr:hypothetical protein [Terriglobia bacterium]